MTVKIYFSYQAMEVIKQGLSDPQVRFGRRLALIQRAKRIISSPAFQRGKKKKSENFTDLDLKEPNLSKSVRQWSNIFFCTSSENIEKL